MGAWGVLKALEKSKNIARRLVQMSVDSVQQVDDAVLNSQAGLVGELQWVGEGPDHRPKLLQDEPLQGLHNVGRQSHRSVVLRVAGTWLLWHRNEAGRLPQHGDSLEVQAQAEDLAKYSTQLGGTGFKHPWRYTIGACSLARMESFQLSSHQVRCEGRCRGDSGGRGEVLRLWRT